MRSPRSTKRGASHAPAVTPDHRTLSGAGHACGTHNRCAYRPHTGAECAVTLIVSTIGLLNDIAIATLAAAKLVLRSAAAAGLNLDGNPEILASIEEMSDRTARQHLEQVASMLLGDRPEIESLHLKTDPRQLRLIAGGGAAPEPVEASEPLPGRAAHVLGEIMLLLSRSRQAVAGDQRLEAYEDLAQVLAMMALAKVLFSLIETEVVGPLAQDRPAGETSRPR